VAGRYLTFLVVPDNDAEPRRFRLPVWLFRTLYIFIAAVLLAPFVYALLYFHIISLAARAGQLAEENESLRRYQYKVQVLEQSLLETRRLAAQMAMMAGLDSALMADLYGGDERSAESSADIRPGSLSRTLPPTSPIPDGLPATGFITRGFSDLPGKRHDGVDIAIPEGAPVFSTAFGEIVYAGYDSAYGNMVIIRSSDSIETVFGHNSRLLVQIGDTVFASQRIAMSGNTGQSSAPHLHYEIRLNGKAINPMKYFVYED